MKCELCRKRMKPESGSADVQIAGATVRVVNMPVLACPSCGKRVLHDMIIGRAKSYAAQYGVDNGTLDFSACEQKEGEDMTVITSMLWNM